MGKASRWFRGLLGMKKEKERVDNSNSGNRKEKKSWSFGKSGRDSGVVGQIAFSVPAVTDSTWLRSYLSETEKEQNKHVLPESFTFLPEWMITASFSFLSEGMIRSSASRRNVW